MSNLTRPLQRNVVLMVVALLMLSACIGDKQAPNSTPVSKEVLAFNGFIYGGNIQRTGVYNGGGGPRFGDRLWKYKAEDFLDSQVIVANGLAFMAVSDQGIHAIDIKSGEVRYTLESYGHLPTVADGVLYYGGKDGLHAMELATRKSTGSLVYETTRAGVNRVTYGTHF